MRAKKVMTPSFMTSYFRKQSFVIIAVIDKGKFLHKFKQCTLQFNKCFVAKQTKSSMTLGQSLLKIIIKLPVKWLK